MKTTNCLQIGLLALSLAIASSVSASPASEFRWFTCSTSLPDTASPSFAPARERVMSWLKAGCSVDLATRVGDPTGVELAPLVDLKVGLQPGDLTTSTFTNFWRLGRPGGVFVAEKGNRAYCPMILMGLNGTVSLHQIRYSVAGGMLGNSATLNGYDYNSTRIGILYGPDGVLFTSDDVYVTSGVGSQQVNAVAYLGARAAWTISDPSQTNGILNIVTQTNTVSGFNLTFEYECLDSNNQPVSRTLRSAWVSTNTFSGIRWCGGPRVGQILFYVSVPDSSKSDVESSSDVDGTWSKLFTSVSSGQLWSVMPTEPRKFYKRIQVP